MAWRRKPRTPKGLQEWPKDAVNIPISKVIELYENGFAGTKYDPEAREALFESLPEPDGESVATKYGLAETGAGKLSIPFKFFHDHYPKAWPCPGQETGSCVGHGGKNSGCVLLGVEAALAQPDPTSGKIEGWPEVASAAEDNGVLCWENIYGDRGHGGQGASCDRLIQHVTSWGGYLLRQNYPDEGIDLTNYQTSKAISWGSSQTPNNIRALGKSHQAHTATNANTHEVCRDFLASGYPIWCCSGYGWSSTRDDNGYSRQSGSWSHSWIIMGYDDRDEVKKIYGFPLALYCHDWGKWNSGGRRIYGTNVDIPEGCMWIDARLLNNCDCTAISNMSGWPRRQLPNWNLPAWG